MTTAERNDLLRARIPVIEKPNVLCLTHGIYAKFNDDEIAIILAKVKNYTEFNPDNDPWQEHDFGSFTYQDTKIFWKIDDYAGENGTHLVLTIMLSDDY